MQDLTGRMTGQPGVPSGYSPKLVTNPGQLSRPGASSGTEDGHHHAGLAPNPVLDALTGQAPKLNPSMMDGGNMAADPSVKAGEQTAPGSLPVTPLPTALAGEHLGPASVVPTVTKGQPDHPWEYSSEGQHQAAKFAADDWTPAGGPAQHPLSTPPKRGQ